MTNKTTYRFVDSEELKNIIREHFRKKLCQKHAEQVKEINVLVDSSGAAAVEYVMKGSEDE